MLNFFSHDVFTSGHLREFPGQDEVTLCQQRIISCPSEIQGVRVAMGRHEQLLPWAVTSNCRHGPSRAIAVMGRHERFRSELAAGFEAQKKKCQPGRRRAFECLDRRQDVSLVEYGHSHGELHRAIKGREEASSAASSEERALASEPAPVAPRIPSSSSVTFFLTTEDQTSACTTGGCLGRSRNSRTMSSAAAPEKQPPQHEFPLLRGRASAGNCGPRRGTELLSGAA